MSTLSTSRTVFHTSTWLIVCLSFFLSSFLSVLYLIPTQVMVSTVAPNPEVFSNMARLPCTIAWSVHAVEDALRKRLVPSTAWSMVELREGLINALGLYRGDHSGAAGASSVTKLPRRAVLIEYVLIDGVNDSSDHADKLADFLRPIMDCCSQGLQRRRSGVLVNLLPYNPIYLQDSNPAPWLGKPPWDRVLAFQAKLREAGVWVSVRSARGDEDSSACGQLVVQTSKPSVATAPAQALETVSAAKSRPVHKVCVACMGLGRIRRRRPDRAKGHAGRIEAGASKGGVADASLLRKVDSSRRANGRASILENFEQSFQARCKSCEGSGLVIDEEGHDEEEAPPAAGGLVAVCGGGIGGLGLALALQHRGIRCSVFERDSSFEDRSQGYAYTVQQVCVRARVQTKSSILPKS